MSRRSIRKRRHVRRPIMINGKVYSWTSVTVRVDGLEFTSRGFIDVRAPITEGSP